MIERYNANMGGVDVCDMLSTYRIRQKSNKYYTHIIYYCISISMANSWLIYHRHMAQQTISKMQQYTSIQFQSLIASSSALEGKPTSSTSLSRGRPSLKFVTWRTSYKTKASSSSLAKWWYSFRQSRLFTTVSRKSRSL